MRIFQRLYYTGDFFHIQFKKIRLYRGFQRQAHLSEELEVSRQVYKLWELGKRKPSYNQLVLIANTLQVDPEYFFKENAEPVDYDLAIANKEGK